VQSGREYFSAACVPNGVAALKRGSDFFSMEKGEQAGHQIAVSKISDIVRPETVHAHVSEMPWRDWN
jgi:hypothetical protein